MTDWEDLAEHLGALGENGEHGGTEFARRAVSELLGPSAILAAVRHAMSPAPGAQLAEDVLRLLKPAAAQDECVRLILAAGDPVQRQRAMLLLARIADRFVIDRLDELFGLEPEVGSLAIHVLEGLVWDGEAEVAELDPWIQFAEAMSSAAVRSKARRLTYDVRMVEEPFRDGVMRECRAGVAGTDTQARLEALAHAGMTADASSVKWVAPLLDDPSAEIQSAAARFLLRLGDSGCLGESQLAGLAATMVQHDSAEVRRVGSELDALATL